MFLIINDEQCLKNDRSYCLLRDKFYEYAVKICPELRTVNTEDVEEILIYTHTDVATLQCKIARCKEVIHDEKNIKIIYDNITQIEQGAKNVNSRLYRYVIKNGLLKKEKYLPYVVLIKDFHQYIDIKENTNYTKYVSFAESIDECKRKAEWLDIVNKFPSENDIVDTEYWNNVYILGELEYALSQIVNNTNSKNADKRRKYTNYFLTINSRCIELEPESSKHKSGLAYYYYTLVREGKKDCFINYYDKALELYNWLIEKSSNSYKEFYRRTRLKELYHDHLKITDFNSSLKMNDEILNDYKYLIDKYGTIEDEKKKKFQKEYIKTLYNNVKFYIDNKLYYVKLYTDNRLYGKEIKLSSICINEIPQLEKMLDIIIDIRQYSTNKRLNINEKPGFFDVYYRKAQIEQIKGIIYIIKEQKDSDKFFEESNRLVDLVLDKANFLQNKIRFKYPDYVIPVKALNLFLLGKNQECHKCFRGQVRYQIYEEAVLYALDNKKKEAINLLRTIPQKDMCYNKSQTLIERLQNDL